MIFPVPRLYIAYVNEILPHSPVVCTAPHSQRAYDYQSIHAQTIITSMYKEHTTTRASMLKPEHPCSRALVYQSIRAQTRITFMFETIHLPEHPCPNQKNIHLPKQSRPEKVQKTSSFFGILKTHISEILATHR